MNTPQPAILEHDILRKMRERTIKNFMDMLILAELREGRPMSGYDVIMFIHKKFHILITSGTVYALLYSMERNGLIKGSLSEGKRIYVLTEKGEETIKVILNAYEKILSFMANPLK